MKRSAPRERCSAAAPGRRAFALVPRELEPRAQGANALDHVGALRVEAIRVDRVNSPVSNRRNRFKTLPRLERVAPEAARDESPRAWRRGSARGKRAG